MMKASLEPKAAVRRRRITATLFEGAGKIIVIAEA